MISIDVLQAKKADTRFVRIAALVVAVVGGVALRWNSIFPRQPEGVYFQPAEGHFGELSPDEDAAFEAMLCNRTGHRLVIDRINRSCGCMDATIGKETLEPGASAPLLIKVDPSQKQGYFKVFAELSYRIDGDPTPKTLPIMTDGFVPPEYEITPDRLAFGEHRTLRQQSVVIRPNTFKGLRVLAVRCPFSAFSVAHEELPNGDWKINITCNPRANALPPGKYVVEVDTNAVRRPTARISLNVDSLSDADFPQ